MYNLTIELTKRPRTTMLVEYNQPLDKPLSPFFVTGMYHQQHDGVVVIMTNLCHVIMDIMTTGYFAPLRIQIEHEIEMARRKRVEALE